MEYKITDAKIHLNAVQQDENEAETVIDFFTTGSYYHKNNTDYINYTEQGEGMENVRTTIKAQGSERVTIIRHGDYNFSFELAVGERRHAAMELPYGMMMFGISGVNIDYALNESGGKLGFVYLLDVNNVLFSKNRFEIEITKNDQ